jgi:SAM-dependent methyltransferase
MSSDAIYDIFNLGMKRFLPKFDPIEREGIRIEIGSGIIPIEGTVQLNFPAYDADKDEIPYDDNTVSQIHCYHVLEHLTNPLFFLSECSRVLAIGKTINIVTPHYLGSMSYHDLTHKHHFSVDIFKTLLSQEYYDAKYSHMMKFEIVGAIVIGIVDRNLAIMAQLRKTQ